MSGEIKKGDLVMVVRAPTCCGRATKLGDTFTVGAVDHRAVVHETCKRVVETRLAYVPEYRLWCEVSRLIKIDPPAVPQEALEEVSA